MSQNSTIIRRRYNDGIIPDSVSGKWAEAWLKVLIAQDGSTTLLCETIAQGPIHLEFVHQQVTRDIPEDIQNYLEGERFIERQTYISFKNEVMMDNLSYISLDQIDPEVRRRLQDGKSPIGYIFDNMLTRKRLVPSPACAQQRMWERSGVPDPACARSYVLEIQENSCIFITETFRAGMRFGLPEADKKGI